jgi:hypothetical protein
VRVFWLQRSGIGSREHLALGWRGTPSAVLRLAILRDLTQLEAKHLPKKGRK